MSVPLDLEAHFPATSAERWTTLVQRQGVDLEKLIWNSPYGLPLKPFCTAVDVPYLAGPLRREAGWEIVSSVTDSRSLRRAIQHGTTALSIDASKSPDLYQLLRGISRDGVSLHWKGATASFVTELDDTLNDLGITPRGTIECARSSFDAIAELTCLGEHSCWRTVHSDTRPFHHRGASLILELCVAVGQVAYLFRKLTTIGMAPQSIAKKLFYSVCVGTSYLPEIAKLRALRHLTHILFEAYGVTDVPVFIRATTSLRSHSTLDSDTNYVRASCQAMSAIVGGCDALLVEADDKIPVQQILLHEAHLGTIADPGAGSYYIEYLTDLFAKTAWKKLQCLEIDQSFNSGLIDELIDVERHKTAKEYASGTQTITGVNAYPTPDSPSKAFGSCYPEYYRAAAPYEHIRTRVLRITNHLGRTVTGTLLDEQSMPDQLRTQAFRILEVGGIKLLTDSSMDADILARTSVKGPDWGTLTLTADRTTCDIYPGCNMVEVLDRLTTNLIDHYGLEDEG